MSVISADTFCEKRMATEEEAKIICEKGHTSCCVSSDDYKLEDTKNAR